jgi:preprotein translocase subunit SecF
MRIREFNLDYMGPRKVVAWVTAGYLLFFLGAIFVKGLNWGLDFTGGTLIELEFPQAVSAEKVRLSLEDAGYVNGVVQAFGSERDVIVRMPPQSTGDQARLGDAIHAALRESFGEVTLKQSSFVGPVVGEELRDDAGLAVLASLGVITIYVIFRFARQFALGSVLALVHDALFVVGCFAVFQWTFDLTVLAAVLTVIGYSINDSIVIADRIRENFRLLRGMTPAEVINKSLNQVLARTIVTAGLTFLTVLAMLIFGGEMIRGFSIALAIGVVMGTYSSIYVLAALLIATGIKREDLLVPVVEEGPTQEGPV